MLGNEKLEQPNDGAEEACSSSECGGKDGLVMVGG